MIFFLESDLILKRPFPGSFVVAWVSGGVQNISRKMYFFFGMNKKNLKTFWFWGILVMLWFSTVLGFFAESNALLGGMIGFETNDFLQDYLGFAGTVLLLAFILIVYLVARLNVTPEMLAKYFHKTKKEVAEDFDEAKQELEEIVDFLKNPKKNFS